MISRRELLATGAAGLTLGLMLPGASRITETEAVILRVFSLVVVTCAMAAAWHFLFQ